MALAESTFVQNAIERVSWTNFQNLMRAVIDIKKLYLYKAFISKKNFTSICYLIVFVI